MRDGSVSVDVVVVAWGAVWRDVGTVDVRGEAIANGRI